MLQFKNSNGEFATIHNIKMLADGRIVSEDNEKAEKFCIKWCAWIIAQRDADGAQFFTMADGVSLARAERKKREKKVTTPEPKPEPAPVDVTPEPVEIDATPADVTPVETSEPAPVDVTPEPKPEPKKKATAPKNDLGGQLVELLSKVQGANIDAAAVRRIVSEELEKYAKEDASRVKRAAKKATKNDAEVYCQDFDDIVEDVREGFMPYLYGAAGCGKSHTAEQVARALGLPFYPMQQLLFAYDVAGYGDAAGQLVETPFYKAFTGGGLVFFDEFDSSAPEAAIVVNGAIANGRYNFPVVGVKTAHPDFRVIAAGNTCGLGADTQYTGRTTLDASTRDRMSFYEMTYDERVELPIMANGDAVLLAFVNDVRQSCRAQRIDLIVSYRCTKYLACHAADKKKAIARGMLKGMEADEIRAIYDGLNDTKNPWAAAMKSLTK